MTTAIDTNIIVALWNEDDALNRRAKDVLDAASARGGLTVSGVVYAELLAAPLRTEHFLNQFFQETGIVIDWEIDEKILRAAGLAFRGYASRRKRQKDSEPRRILADFLIGSHAFVKNHRLLTLDARLYRAAFPRLDLAEI